MRGKKIEILLFPLARNCGYFLLQKKQDFSKSLAGYSFPPGSFFFSPSFFSSLPAEFKHIIKRRKRK